MQLDFKAGFFWKEQTVLELATTILDMRINYNTELSGFQRDKLSDILQDLVVETTYGEPRQITVTGLSHKKIYEIHFPDEQHNSELSIIDYFGKRYGKKIFYQKLPCIKEYCQKTRHHNFYPIEYCKLLGGQRIEMLKQTPEQMAVAVPKAALKPSDRWPEIEKLAKEANIFENDFLAELGIEVAFSGTKVEGRVLTPPDIECKFQGKSKILKVKPKADWDPQNCQFFMPAKCPTWSVAIFKNKDGSQPITELQMAKFVTMLVKAGQARGMIIGEPIVINSLFEEQLEKYGETVCKQNNTKFLMFVTGRKQGGAVLHDKVKQYFEEDLKILTQQLVEDRTVGPILQNRSNAKQLMQNILFKTNTKLGGLNYSIKIDGILKTNRMFVSYDVSHPTHLRPDQQMSIPSVVGLCTNSGNHPLKLTGNYGYQRMRQEEVGDLLKHLMIQQLRIWFENRKNWPTEVIVLRDGISEGQYRKVLEQELPLIFAAFDELGAPKPKIEVFVVEKRHNARFKPENINPSQGSKDQNVPPGTVIDQKVVHATHEEFYLCTHLTIQGTAKIPRYDKLWNEIGLSKNEIQSIIFGMAYNHQIIAQPVSLPATLYAAHELAKRGKNTRKARIGREESSSGFSSDSGLARAGSLHSVDTDDEISKFKLGIDGALAHRKFWA
jgi:eukaryotic translation initiation factor 2C